MCNFIPSKEISKVLLEEEIGKVNENEFDLAYEMSIKDVKANKSHDNFMNMLSWSVDLVRRQKLVA